jgi:hypothetical protein
MAIESRNISKLCKVAWTPLRLGLGTTAVSQTALVAHGVTIPHPFQIVRVEINALTVAATITVDVQIGTTSVLNAVMTPVAATPVVGVLSTTIANTRSAVSTGAVLNLLYTSNGSGAATSGTVTVWYRPYGMKGDANPLLGESA